MDSSELCTILLAALLYALPAFAADLTGRWWGDAVSGNDSQPVYLIVFQEGNILKGTGGPDPQNQALLTNGKIQGSRVASMWSRETTHRCISSSRLTMPD